MQRSTERNEQLERLSRRYAGRGKEGKSRLLDEFCEHYGYERKYAIKLLRQEARRRAGSREAVMKLYMLKSVGKIGMRTFQKMLHG